tara:strand:+ start:261 stop:605 length:345 start_codon:yes stop_codon:yes gene_type:complete
MKIFVKESNDGNIEYKLNLSNMSKIKFQKYSTQLKYRILEGTGTAIYIIGISDNGSIFGINNCDINNTINLFNYICKNVNCSIDLILKCKYINKFFLIIKVSCLFNINNLPYLI